MKLYTEEELRQAFAISDFYGLTNGILEKCTPIELPSDEDEEKAAFSLTKNLQQHMGFNIGAKWMRDKIQGGSNEQKVISETASTNTAAGFWVKDLKVQGGNNEQQ